MKHLESGWGPPMSPDFIEAVGVAVDSGGRVFVYARAANAVQIFDADGARLGAWEHRFERPHGIYIGPDDSVYLTDDFGHAVYKYSPSGELLLTLGTPGRPTDTGMRDFDYRQIERGAGPFHYPTNLALNEAGEMFVCDGYGNARVHRFSAAGEWIASWGEPGGGHGEFRIPHGIAVDSRGLVVVADRENTRLEFFEQDGRHVETWADVVRPTDIFVTPGGDLWVTELGNVAGRWPWMEAPESPGGRLSLFDRNGKLLWRRDTGFYAPHDVWAAADGSVYVAEVVWSAGGRLGKAPEWARTLHRLKPGAIIGG